MQRIADNYRDLRNRFRYILGNLYDFDPRVDALPFEKLESIDRYMLRQMAALAVEVERAYEEFAFHKIYHRVNDFCTVELSRFYFDVLKDRLYTAAPFSLGRRAAQTAIWRIGEALVRLLAPVMSFTCEEVWQYLPPVDGRQESVHVARFPTAADILGPSAPPEVPREREDWTTLLAVRDEVLKGLEEARNNKLIGTGLEARVTLVASEPAYSVLERHQNQLRYLFIVSDVTLEKTASGNGAGGITVKVAHAEGRKCERCWNYSVHVGEDSAYPTVCERCAAVLKEIKTAGRAN
jgi:isoleucyl-tRNA synthetase